MSRIPFALPDTLRSQHHHICAGSGFGKTQSLQYLIAQDVKARHGVVVIDSQGDLIRNISRLKSVSDRLVLVDPADVEFPIALNLFNFGTERLSSYSKTDQQALRAGIIELYDFIMSSLLGASLTSKQSTAFRFVVRAMLQIPNATILDLVRFLQDAEPYQEHIDKLTGITRQFFEHEYDSKEFADTRRQVVRRLYGVLENDTFAQVFSSPVNKLDLFQEMNAGKVILISTDKRLLKQEGCQIFGRFFIAMIMQAANERAVLALEQRRRCHVYIDECQDYIDHNIALMLEQARKYNVGLVLAHQYLGQLPAQLQASLSANTAIKQVGGVSAEDARRFAAQMQCESSVIEKQKPGSFAVWLRGQGTFSLTFPFGYVEALPKLTETEFDAVQQRIRDTYSSPSNEPAPVAAGMANAGADPNAAVVPAREW